ALCSRLFCSVENGDHFYAFRNCIYKCFSAEWSVKTYFYDSDFLSFCKQVVNSLIDCLTYRSHSNDYMLSILCSVVVEQFVVCSDLCVYFVHVFLNDGRHCVIVRITCFSCLEEYVRVLSGSSFARMIWI